MLVFHILRREFQKLSILVSFEKLRWKFITKFLANWTPLTNEEKELFDKRLEFGAKNRRRFWEMKYNPKTEGYFCGQTSDRAWAQHEWVNSVWFEQAACNNTTTYFKLVSFKMNKNHQKINSHLD